MRTRLFSIVLCLAFTAGCDQVSQSVSMTKPLAIERVPVEREFRAAWVATEQNINWPSRPGLSAEQQKAEAIAMLDFLERNNFNAVILQVRPQCDAFYVSDMEPWSGYLSGTQGMAPQPFYDPLQFWIDSAHDRGLELHAWFNPYRAHSDKDRPPANTSIVYKRPQMVKRLENGMYWLNPTHPQTPDYLLDVIMDVVRRYDIDGVHFDDYFYPYPAYNAGKDFPDDDTWQTYVAAGGNRSRADWRRDAVSALIQKVYWGIKAEKQYVKFGISPFGIWRPGNPPSISGLDQYNQLYADSRLWLNQGWVDYFSPQLYWPINQPQQSFPILLGWWDEQNLQGRHLWPGINASLGTAECINQITITRELFGNTDPGVIHWNVDALIKNSTMPPRLTDALYAKKTLVPLTPWLDSIPPARPDAKRKGKSILFSPADEADIFRWIVSVQKGNQWEHTILCRNQRSFLIPKNAANHAIVYAVDRMGNMSLPAAIAVK